MIFCLIHVHRTIRKVAPNLSVPFIKLTKSEIEASDFINFLNLEISRFQREQTKGLRKLQLLQQQSEMWLPSHTEPLNHFGNNTSNRVEGAFGDLKILTDRNRLPLAELVNAINCVALEFSRNSLVKTLVDTVYPDEYSDVIDSNSWSQLGNFAKDKLLIEMQLSIKLLNLIIYNVTLINCKSRFSKIMLKFSNIWIYNLINL
jgi:hypothetical protein